MRTCVGCRVRAPKSELLRVVAVDGDAVIDAGRRLPGRGAHLHPDPGCLALALRRKALPRALRYAGDLRCTGLTDQISQLDQMGSTGRTPTTEGG
ncbi:MAG TPA: YlxR family protein [Mycobacteriales bacterium]|nr:YlxR family protein [Mycobacteriales bacterium]